MFYFFMKLTRFWNITFFLRFLKRSECARKSHNVFFSQICMCTNELCPLFQNPSEWVLAFNLIQHLTAKFYSIWGKPACFSIIIETKKSVFNYPWNDLEHKPQQSPNFAQRKLLIRAWKLIKTWRNATHARRVYTEKNMNLHDTEKFNDMLTQLL